MRRKERVSVARGFWFLTSERFWRGFSEAIKFMQDVATRCLIVPFLLPTKKLNFPLVSEDLTLVDHYVLLRHGFYIITPPLWPILNTARSIHCCFEDYWLFFYTKRPLQEVGLFCVRLIPFSSLWRANTRGTEKTTDLAQISDIGVWL